MIVVVNEDLIDNQPQDIPALLLGRSSRPWPNFPAPRTRFSMRRRFSDAIDCLARRSFRSGALSRRVRTALERGLQEGEGSAAAVQRVRNDGLEGRLKDAEDRGEALGKGLAAVRGTSRRSGTSRPRGFGRWNGG